jgi:hypothetical protein
MTGSRRAQQGNPLVMRTIILGLAVLVLGVGFCLFDTAGHDGADGHASVDLCLGLLAASVSVVLVASLPRCGSTRRQELSPVHAFSPLVPAPPPKTSS